MGPGSGIRNGLAGLALVALLGATAWAGDADVQRRIEDRLAKEGLDRATSIVVHVDDGVVHLTGLAVNLGDSREAEKAARREAKVVINEVRVVPERKRSDRAILHDVEGAILGYNRYGVFDAVGAEVDDGMVRLTGFVLDNVRRSDLENRVARVEGVRDVHNDLRLQGGSPGDVQLRWQIYQRIYTDPMFERYASWTDPPVRVLVERGRVTLAGTVGSPVEQAMVGNIARDSLAFSVTNHVQVEHDRSADEDSAQSDS